MNSPPSLEPSQSAGVCLVLSGSFIAHNTHRTAMRPLELPPGSLCETVWCNRAVKLKTDRQADRKKKSFLLVGCCLLNCY